jgi:hypothetical protein
MVRMSGRVTRWLEEKRITIFSLLAVDEATSCDVTLIEGCHQQIFIPFPDSQTSNNLQQTMMMHSRLSLTAIMMLTSTASAFAPSRNQGKVSFITLSETPHSVAFLRENFQKAVGIAILGSVLAFHVPPASAYLSPHGKQESCSRVSLSYMSFKSTDASVTQTTAFLLFSYPRRSRRWTFPYRPMIKLQAPRRVLPMSMD